MSLWGGNDLGFWNLRRLLNRANHIGTQAIATILGLQTLLDGLRTDVDNKVTEAQATTISDTVFRLLHPEFLLSSFTGATDKLKLDAAVAAADDAGGGVVIIDYDISVTALSYNSGRTNVTLRGKRQQTSITLTATGTRALYIQGPGWRLENLTINVAGLATSAGVEVRGDDFTAERVIFNLGAAVANTSGVNINQGSSRCRVTQCRFIGGETGVLVHNGSHHVTVDHNHFTGQNYKAAWLRGNAAGGGWLNIDSNTFDDLGEHCQPIRVEETTHDLPFTNIVNNDIRDTAKRAGGNDDSITINGVGPFAVQNNRLDRASDVGINIATGAHDGIVSGNVVKGAYNAGINLGQLVSTTTPLSLTRTERVHVTGNVMVDCGDRWDDPVVGANNPFSHMSALRTTDCTFENNVGYVTGDAAYAPINGMLLGDNERLSFRNNRLLGYTGDPFQQIANDSAIAGGGPITTTWWEVNGEWDTNPSMASGAPGGSLIVVAGAALIWSGTAWEGVTARARRIATCTAGATPTFTASGDISGARTGTGVYVYTFATALPADACISVDINQSVGRTLTWIIAGDRLTLTVYTFTTTTAADNPHTVMIV